MCLVPALGGRHVGGQVYRTLLDMSVGVVCMHVGSSCVYLGVDMWVELSVDMCVDMSMGM